MVKMYFATQYFTRDSFNFLNSCRRGRRKRPIAIQVKNVVQRSSYSLRGDPTSAANPIAIRIVVPPGVRARYHPDAHQHRSQQVYRQYGTRAASCCLESQRTTCSRFRPGRHREAATRIACDLGVLWATRANLDASRSPHHDTEAATQPGCCVRCQCLNI